MSDSSSYENWRSSPRHEGAVSPKEAGSESPRGWRERPDGSSNWRDTTRSRLINLQTDLSSSIDNLNIQSTFARSSTEHENLVSDPDFSSGSYFKMNRATRGKSWRNRNSNPKHRRKIQYDSMMLTELLPRPPEEIIMNFLENEEDLQKYMESWLEPDSIVLLTRTFAKVCSSKFTANLGEVLTIALNDKYLEQLLEYVIQLPLQDELEKRGNKSYWDKVEEFWSSLWIFFSQLHERVPTIAVDILPKQVSTAVYTLQNLEGQLDASILKDMLAKFKELEAILAKAREVVESRGTKRRGDDENPPDDFRELSIYPTAKEVTTNAKPFVRSNIIVGSYRDVEHYLDVQFRLLREDFVAPLRKGITEYLCCEDNKRLSNIKVYTKVKAMGMERVHNQIGYIVQVVKAGQIKNVDNTKHFMFGSLVCFTTDNFETILFGKVINGDKEKLRLGQIVVGFDIDDSLHPKVEYTMAECMVYFEPYYRVLSALQKMDPNDFPLKNYLVDVDFVSKQPDYVLQRPVFYIDYFKVNVTLRETWPHHEQMQLNESQFKAFYSAVNNKMCVIQGPPGTGKTYLALQITKMLLENYPKWKCFGPILLICYTNHALDQFLEGLLGTTDRIVRVGGQSKSSRLARCNIKEKRKEFLEDHPFLRERLFEIRQLGDNFRWETKKLSLINKFESILKPSVLCFYVPDLSFEETWFATASEDNILKWLLEESKQGEWKRNIEPIGSFKEGEIDNGYIDERMKDIADIDDEFLEIVRRHTTYGNIVLVTIEDLQRVQLRLARMLHGVNRTTYEHFLLASQYNRAVNNMDYLQYRLQQLRTGQLNVPPTNIDLDNPYKMSFDDRWRLYASWLAIYRDMVEWRIQIMDNEYRTMYTKYDELREMCDTTLLRENLVIGMTTTGAAKLQTLLEALKCPIVIVEEAAEVLESHVITALTSSCQQLLLIGDHKQLRPSTADYEMDVHYHLGISLFERMIRNGFPCNTLNEQHRMRPEIAALVAPSIYPDLQNHHSVSNFEEIKGVNKSLYFITHQHAEQESPDQSKENRHEVTFLMQLAQYLVLNGYEAEKITVLAAYSGQLFLLLKEQRNYLLLSELNIKVLDNYQGEENDIILLSLVRNNSEGKIGFLHLENRVCVALSRARMGMYVMGNMDLLCEKSKIWPKIREVFERQNAIGDSLLLRCQNHPDHEIEVKCGNDFKKAPEGGCMKLCDTLLECGHNCDRFCHIIAHDLLLCEKLCTNIICEFFHICPKKCFEECEKCMVPKYAVLPCGHEHDIPCHMSPEEVNCPTEIDATLPCGHATRKKCYLDVNLVPCGVPCNVLVEPCGHLCLRNCHVNDDPNHKEYKCMKDCERQNEQCSLPDNVDHKCRKRCYEKCTPCDIKVTKTRTVCLHTHKVNCSEDVDKIECKRRCTKTLPCGHECKSWCSQMCNRCMEMVEKIIEDCGHKVECACSVTPTRRFCESECERLLNCGHKCTKMCNEICDSKECQELVTKSNVTCPQGHILTVPCNVANGTTKPEELLTYCLEKCTAQLECGHRCSGTCLSCAQGRVHVDCTKKCNKILVCGHECDIPCLGMCQPCTLQCSYRCGHSRCSSDCSSPCTPCQEPCRRQCPHVQCRKKCHEICEVEPCNEPCPKKLKCGHDCIGFCGDECPPLCRTCDADIVTECFFGIEDNQDARFVYLPNCKHVLESSGLKQWMDTCAANEISFPRCPKCKGFITCLQRYDEYLKSSLEDVKAVKNKFNGNAEANNARLQTLLADVQILGPDLERLGATKLYERLKFALHINKNKLNQQQLQSYAMKIQILQQLCHTSRTEALTKKEAKEIVQEHVKFLLGYLHDRNSPVNNQKRDDMELELKRFARAVQLATIVEESLNYSELPEYKKCRDLVFSYSRYNDETDAVLKRELSELSEKSNSGVIVTDPEKNRIGRAINLSVGHWFRCPNGHPHTIGECDGAIQMDTCLDCGTPKGSGGETLLDVTTVMDESMPTLP